MAAGPKLVAVGSCFVGARATNNRAEYEALVRALECAFRSCRGRDVEVRGDSLLVVNQMRGDWKVRTPALVEVHRHATSLVRGSGVRVTFAHVPRAANGAADWLANRGVCGINEEVVAEVAAGPTLAGVKTVVRAARERAE